VLFRSAPVRPIEDYEHVVSSENALFEDVVNEGGTLGAGRYVFILNTVAGADFVELDGRSVSSVQSIQLTDGLFQFTEVPAPGAASLLGLGLCAAARRRR